MDPSQPVPPPPPAPQVEPQPPARDSGPSVLTSLLLLLLPSLACVTLGVLNKAFFGNKDVLVVPLLIAAFLGPVIVGILASIQITRRLALNPGLGVLMALGFIVASFALCIPGCAVLL
ncbi:MAG: hypothetical protein AB7O66_03235 [Limisphaerales bacterium]